MAGGGIGEAALLGAALSAAQNKDPLQGALMGGLGGLAFGAFGGEALGEAGGLGATDFSLGQAGTQNAFANSLGSQEMIPIQDTGTGLFGNASSIAGNPALSGIPAAGANVTNGISQLDTNLYNPNSLTELNAAQTAELEKTVPLARGLNPMANQTLAENAGGSMLDTTAGAFNPPAATPFAGYETPDLVSGAYGASTPAASGIGNLLSGNGKYYLAGGLGLNYLMNQDKAKYGIPAVEKYEGPLSKFKYDPMTYRPDVVTPPTPYRPVYAGGGPVEQMSNQNAIGANTGFPQAYLHNAAYATPYQTPISQNVLTGPGDTAVDPYTGEQKMASGGSVRHYDIGGEIGGAFNSIGNGIGRALGGVNNLITNAGQGQLSLADQPGTMSWDDPRFKARMEAMLQGKPVPQYASGGISSLGSYSDGGRMLKGPGDGMSDNIPARIGGKQEARLADGEFVVPADVVSHLGNGSTDAGAKQLYSMMDKVRRARTGRKQQGRQIQPQKYMPA